LSRINVKLGDYAGDKGNAIIGKKIHRVEEAVFKITAQLKVVEERASLVDAQIMDIIIRLEDIENELE